MPPPRGPGRAPGGLLGFAVPRTVSCPSTANTSAFFFVTVALVKAMAGYVSTAKKSSLRRCTSRSGVPVSTLAVLIEKVSDDCDEAPTKSEPFHWNRPTAPGCSSIT